MPLWLNYLKNGELPGLSAVTLSDNETGTEPVLEQSEESESEQLSSSFAPATPHHATKREAVEQVVSGEQLQLLILNACKVSSDLCTI